MTEEEREIVVIIQGCFSNTPNELHAFQVITKLREAGYEIRKKEIRGGGA